MYSPRVGRRTRWGPEGQVAEINGLKTAITTAMTPEQVDTYALNFRIEKIGQKIQLGDLTPSTNSRTRIVVVLKWLLYRYQV
jgi:hypothetical protein